MERQIHPGEFYRHFKNKLYQIIAVATHSETGEAMVVYQALYGDFQVYVRPYAMFVSKVDREKYPDAEQEYRFEKVVRGEVGADVRAGQTLEAGVPAQEPAAGLHPALLEFMDAENFAGKRAALQKLAKEGTQREFDSLYLVLDMKPEPGSIREQAAAVDRFLAMQERYDGSRLR